MSISRIFGCLALCLCAVDASAEGWCDLPAGSYDVRTHGTLSNQVWLVGPLSGGPVIWILVANDTVGKNNVAVILAAQLAGKGLSIYLDAPSATCVTYPSFQPIGGVRHVRITG